MSNKNQTSDSSQVGPGTRTSSLTPRPYASGTARHGSGNGASGAGIAGADKSNRNKPQR